MTSGSSIHNQIHIRLEEQQIDKEQLIESVRKYPMIWKLSHPKYKDINSKKIVWVNIAEEYGNRF